jgi:hypothetical protein
VALRAPVKVEFSDCGRANRSGPKEERHTGCPGIDLAATQQHTSPHVPFATVADGAVGFSVLPVAGRRNKDADIITASERNILKPMIPLELVRSIVLMAPIFQLKSD